MRNLEADVNNFKDVVCKSWNKVLLVHHDDADGIISAFLMLKTLESIGHTVHTVCLEKLYPEALKLIARKVTNNDLLVLVDLGSPHASRVLNTCSNVGHVVIIDHHDPEDYQDPKLTHINPEYYGYSGERDASASTMTYIACKRVFSDIVKYAFLVVVGSAEIPGTFRGLNRIAFEDAKAQGLVRELSSGKYEVNFYGDVQPHYTLSSMISTLASLGYYVNGPNLALKACENGFKGDVRLEYEKLMRLRDEVFRKGIVMAYRSLRKSKYTQWFNVGKLLYNIGAKALGLLTSQFTFRCRVDQRLYVVGMMTLNPEIPGLGSLGREYVKISCRVPRLLKSMIEHGKMPPVNKVLVRACDELGGFADGHDYAASGVIPLGSEHELIRIFDDIVENLKG